MNSGVELFLFMLADISPRSGRKWLFIEMYVMSLKQFVKMGQLITELTSLRARNFDGIRASEITQQMRGLVWRHICVPVCCGGRNLSLASKFCTAVHSIRLESSCWWVTVWACSKIIQIVTD